MKSKTGKIIPIIIILGLVLIPGTREWLFQLVQKNNFVTMKEYIQSFGMWGPVISMIMMTINTVIIPLPTFIITVANALVYGWQWGVVISWTGAMIGASINFGIAKIYGRPVVERLVGKKSLAVADGFFERYGKHTIIITRLIPIMSFGLISYTAGLTSIRFWTYFWATGVGQAPATVIYSFIAFSIADEILTGDALISPPILFWALIALLVLGVFAMAAKGFLVEKPKEAQEGEVNG